MKYWLRVLFLLCTVCLLGCRQSDYPAVTGVVTVNGSPRENIRVVFAPMSTKDTNTPGPPSFDVTDEQGRYRLRTKNGDDGAVVGRHAVTFTYADLEPLEDLKIWHSSAESKEEAATVQEKITHVKKEIASRGAISKSSKQTIEIADQGNQDANFEVGNQEE